MDVKDRLSQVRTCDTNKVPTEFRFVQIQREAGVRFFSETLSLEQVVKVWDPITNDPATSMLQFLDDDGQWELV